jgi:hypothetical protein
MDALFGAIEDERGGLPLGVEPSKPAVAIKAKSDGMGPARSALGAARDNLGETLDRCKQRLFEQRARSLAELEEDVAQHETTWQALAAELSPDAEPPQAWIDAQLAKQLAVDEEVEEEDGDDADDDDDAAEDEARNKLWHALEQPKWKL